MCIATNDPSIMAKLTVRQCMMRLLIFWSFIGEGISSYALECSLYIGCFFSTGIKMGNVAFACAPLLGLLL